MLVEAQVGVEPGHADIHAGLARNVAGIAALEAAFEKDFFRQFDHVDVVVLAASHDAAKDTPAAASGKPAPACSLTAKVTASVFWFTLAFMSETPPDALLFITPGCPHCAGVLEGLGELVKQMLIGKMTVVNVAAHPEQAAEYGVRSAPWLRLGPFTLVGAQSPAELRQWAGWANGAEGTAHYVEHLLMQGGYRQALEFIDADTDRLGPLLAIVADPEARLEVRLGASALLEAHAGTPELQRLLPQLAKLSRHADHRVRADACHLLGLSGSAAALAHVEICLDDAHPEVREIAGEAMAALAQQNAKT